MAAQPLEYAFRAVKNQVQSWSTRGHVQLLLTGHWQVKSQTLRQELRAVRKRWLSIRLLRSSSELVDLKLRHDFRVDGQS